MDKDRIDYGVYLLNWLTADIEEIIDARPTLNFENWKKERDKEK